MCHQGSYFFGSNLKPKGEFNFFFHFFSVSVTFKDPQEAVLSAMPQMIFLMCYKASAVPGPFSWYSFCLFVVNGFSCCGHRGLAYWFRVWVGIGRGPGSSPSAGKE